MKADVIIYDTTMMSMFADGEVADLPKAKYAYPRKYYISQCKEKQ